MAEPNPAKPEPNGRAVDEERHPTLRQDYGMHMIFSEMELLGPQIPLILSSCQKVLCRKIHQSGCQNSALIIVLHNPVSVKRFHLKGQGQDRKIMTLKPEELMNKYLVKALVAKEGKSASLRFVPLEIYDLWKSHMQSAYHYRVSAVEVSLWISADSSEAEQGPVGGRGERIIEVRLSKKIGTVAMPVERYFLEEDMTRLLPTFLAHYGIDSANADAMARVHFQKGLFVQPEEVFQDEF